MKYDELISELRSEICKNNCFDCVYMKIGCTPKMCEQAADAIEELQSQLPKWIPVSERLPECEQEVLICTEKKLVGRGAYIDSIVTPAIYEDGTMRENESSSQWVDVDWAGWDEEEDCGIIPEGWWENRHFNPDDVYNNSVDRKVVAWMPLPKPPKEETDG